MSKIRPKSDLILVKNRSKIGPFGNSSQTKIRTFVVNMLFPLPKHVLLSCIKVLRKLPKMY